MARHARRGIRLRRGNAPEVRLPKLQWHLRLKPWLVLRAWRTGSEAAIAVCVDVASAILLVLEVQCSINFHWRLG